MARASGHGAHRTSRVSFSEQNCEHWNWRLGKGVNNRGKLAVQVRLEVKWWLPEKTPWGSVWLFLATHRKSYRNIWWHTRFFASGFLMSWEFSASLCLIYRLNRTRVSMKVRTHSGASDWRCLSHPLTPKRNIMPCRNKKFMGGEGFQYSMMKELNWQNPALVKPNCYPLCTWIPEAKPEWRKTQSLVHWSLLIGNMPASLQRTLMVPGDLTLLPTPICSPRCLENSFTMFPFSFISYPSHSQLMSLCISLWKWKPSEENLHVFSICQTSVCAPRILLSFSMTLSNTRHSTPSWGPKGVASALVLPLSYIIYSSPSLLDQPQPTYKHAVIFS